MTLAPGAHSGAPLRYLHPDVPEPGTSRPISERLIWVRLPLPIRLNHVNCWMLRGDDGWTIVDAGMHTGKTKGMWEEILAQRLDGLPVARVVLTHFHPDHSGLVGWLVETTGARFITSRQEWLMTRLMNVREEGFAESAVRFYISNGCPPEPVRLLTERLAGAERVVRTVPVTAAILRDGQEVQLGDHRWRMHVGRGHSPEMVTLHAAEAGLYIAGDQILPKISPNVSVFGAEPDADPLADYLESLARLRTLPEDVLVLPSHGAPFWGLRERIDWLAAHHEERLDLALEACSIPRTGFEMTGIMFHRDLDPQQMSFAIGEAIAHLNHLVTRGALVRGTDGDGVIRYARA